MDIITPGLNSRTRSRKLLKEINNNNKIAFLIQNSFSRLNRTTELFLSQELIKYNQVNDSNYTILQSALQDTVYLFGLEDFHLERIARLSLGKLKASYRKLTTVSLKSSTNGSTTATTSSRGEKLTTVDDTHDFDANAILALNDTTNNLINHYTLLAVSLNYANSTIYNTLILKSQLVYWEQLSESSWSKFVYFVQILPWKTWEFTKSVYNHVSQSPVVYAYDENAATQEDNLFYNNFIRLQGLFSLVQNSTRKVLLTSFINLNPTFSVVQSKAWTNLIRYIWRTPINIANQEIQNKIALITDEITTNTNNIDTLIKLNYDDKEQVLARFETILGIDEQEDTTNNRMYRLIETVLQTQKAVDYSVTDMPSILTRYWPIIVLLLHYGPSGSINIYNNREEIIHWIKYNLVDTTIGFFKNWLLKPINDMLNILRHDDDFTITSKESLKSDLDSLERMVVEFLADEKVTGITADQIHQSIQNGDLTLIMSQYESQIRTPYKSLIKGGLIRSLLIQIQKTKVDGAVAITGIDKLLKSQQLLFGLVSLSPSVFIVWKLLQYFTVSKPLMINGKQVNILCLKGLNNIENLLILLNNDSNSTGQYEGKLLIEIVNLIITSKLIIPAQLHNDWIRDLNELNNSEYDFSTKLELVRKIWNMYSSYFR